MKLTPLPEDLKDTFDGDSLVYKNDSELFFGISIPESIIEDIQQKEIQIYSGYYEFSKGDDSPTLFYLARGKRSGKVKLKIQGFYPYGYDYDDNGEYTTYFGRRCEKLIFKGSHPAKVKRYREWRTKGRYPQPLECDILFHRRFLIDMYDYFKPKEPMHPKVAIVDIETNHPVSDEIISFALNNLSTGEIFFESKYDGSSSKELTKSLIEKLEDVDVITGWFFVDFDVPIINKYSGKKLNDIVTLVDLLELSKTMYSRELRGGWSLDNSGSRLCGIAKSLDEKDMKGDIRDLNEEKLLIYNVIDVVIPEIIDNYLGGLDAHLILAWSLQMGLDDVTITAVVNDIALLREYHKAGIVLHSRDYSSKDDKEAKYSAADPDARPGVYDGVIETDVVAAYASAVVAINASCETKDKNGIYVAPNGIRFNDKESTFIKTIKHLMNEKIKVKGKLKKMDKSNPKYSTLDFIHYAIKTQVAAFSHGLFGWSNSRMKDYDVADAITSVLSNLMIKIKYACDLIGYEWIYLHTDSCFIHAPRDKVDDILKYLNDVIEKHCKGYRIIPELEFKGYHPHVYIHSKARRVIVPEGVDIDDDESWEVKGMSFMRSETPEALAKIEIELIKLKLKHQDEECLDKLKEMLIELKDVDLKELALVKPLNKEVHEYGRELLDGSWGGVPAHIKAMVKANEDDGLELVVGNKYGVVPIKTDETTGVRVIKMKRVDMAFDLDEGLPDKYEINYEYYLDSNLWGKISGLFDMKVKDLKKLIYTDETVCKELGIEKKK